MKLFSLTAETQRAQRWSFLFVPVSPEQTKRLQPLAGDFLAEGLEFMENRHLPILHKKTLLRVLSVSNEPQLGLSPNWDEWAVNIV
jgi:hypothetical protein